MIVGGGIGGMQAALDMADSGFKVHIIQRDSSIGGTMAMLDKTFPTGDCAMCMISPKMVEVGRHQNVDIHSLSDVISVDGEPGNFTIKVKSQPRFIDLEKCTACGDCAKVCPVSLPSLFEQGLGDRKAVYKPYAQAVPGSFLITKLDPSPCTGACPNTVNAHGYIALIGEKKYKEALEVITRNLPMPGVIGRICPHPCEDECRREMVEEPISICALKRFAADHADINDLPLPDITPRDEKVAIIGAGPAGLTAAYFLAMEGYKVTIFEALPVVGGMLRVGIPDYRLPPSVLEKEIQWITRLGIEIQLNTALGKDITIDGLLEDGFKSVYLAVGCHSNMKLGISGEDLQGVIPGVEFLRDAALGNIKKLQEKVVIIGGGDVAIDASRTALRLGADKVSILYRRTEVEMPAREEEIEDAREEGVDIQFLMAPVEVLGSDGKLTGLKCIRMELGEPDDSGRRRPVPITGSEFIVDTDIIIPAIGQRTDTSFLEGAKGVELNRWSNIETDSITFETARKGVFAGGDAQTGASIAINAVAAGREAAISISRYINGEDLKAGREPVEMPRENFNPIPKNIEKTPRASIPRISMDARKKGFSEVESGLTEEQAVVEAKKCLNCMVCCECFECVKACGTEAVNHEDAEKELEINVGAIILCPGLERYNPEVRQELGFGRWPNVISSIQFERILSASGPYTGVVTRPGDGRHPKKIAWIQCVGSRDSHNANPWCSSVCCMYATKQAVIAKEHDNTIEPTIFYMEMRAFGKDFDKYVDRAKNEYGVRYQRAMISAVREEAGTGDLVMRYAKEDGTLVDETFDMVILSIGLEPHADALEFAKTFGIEPNVYNFAKTTQFKPVNTTRPGVYVTGTYQGPKDIPETIMQGSAVAGDAMALLAEARGTEVVVKELPPEKDVKEEEARTGVFVCHCGTNIANTVDVKKVVEEVKGQPSVTHAENLLYACSQDSMEKIKSLVKEKNLNRVVVASCTPRTHEPLFQETIRDAGLNKYLFELADIREQCSWCHMGQNEVATEKAIDIVKMNVAKAKLLEPVETDSVDVTPGAMIIGGGVAGMTTALSLGDQGFDVHIVEKEGKLGGLVQNVHRTLYGNDVQTFLDRRIADVEAHPRITVHTGVEVKETSGFVGNFTTALTDDSGFEHGAIVITTGGQEYEPTEYLFGDNDRIITQRDLEKRLENETSEAKNSYVMIQCVGSREEPNNYCSRICCQDAVKNAIAIKEKAPDTQVTILYRDIRTYGMREDYYKKARDLGVLFIRFEQDSKPEVEAVENRLRVKTFDYMLNRDIALDADYVVLSTGLRPHPLTSKVGEMYKLTRNPDGYFLEAHVKLRPVDFPSEGIFVAGLAHSPKNLDETISQALAAAGRAGVLLSHDTLSVSGIISKHNRDVCMSCLTCLRVCPFGAPFIDEDGKISHNEVKCTGCGICAAVCPMKAFQVNNFRDEQILTMIDTLTEDHVSL